MVIFLFVSNDIRAFAARDEVEKGSSNAGEVHNTGRLEY